MHVNTMDCAKTVPNQMHPIEALSVHSAEHQSQNSKQPIIMFANPAPNKMIQSVGQWKSEVSKPRFN